MKNQQMTSFSNGTGNISFDNSFNNTIITNIGSGADSTETNITFYDNLIFVTDYGAKTVSIIDSITNNVLTTIPTINTTEVSNMNCLSPIDKIKLIIKVIKILVELGLLSVGICYSSNIKLFRAIKQIEKGNNEEAIEILEDLINDLIGFVNSGFLLNIVAQALIWAIENVIEQLET